MIIDIMHLTNICRPIIVVVVVTVIKILNCTFNRRYVHSEEAQDIVH